MKIFIMTDERCGGSIFGHVFRALGFKVIDDPQTYTPTRDKSINNHANVLRNFETFYDQYDMVKICFIGFSLKEYIVLVNKAQSIGCKLIFLWRKNFLQRAISKAIAQKFDVWNYPDDKFNFRNHRIGNDSGYYSMFLLDEKLIKNELSRNKNAVRGLKKALVKNNIDFYEISYEDLYDKNKMPEQRFAAIDKILKYINYDRNISEAQYARILDLLDVKRKVNDDQVYGRIINYKRLADKFNDY